MCFHRVSQVSPILFATHNNGAQTCEYAQIRSSSNSRTPHSAVEGYNGPTESKLSRVVSLHRKNLPETKQLNWIMAGKKRADSQLLQLYSDHAGGKQLIGIMARRASHFKRKYVLSFEGVAKNRKLHVLCRVQLEPCGEQLARSTSWAWPPRGSQGPKCELHTHIKCGRTW